MTPVTAETHRWAQPDRHPAGVVRRPRLAYFINYFPNLIETMIFREVQAMAAAGYEVYTFSIRKPDESLIPAEARPLAVGTFYILPLSIGRVLSRHLRALCRYPGRYVRTLLEVMGGTHARWRDRLRTLCHFAEAVAVVPEIEHLGIEQLHAHWAVGATTCAMVVGRLLDIPFTFTAHAYDIWREQLLLPQKLQAAEGVVTCTDCNRQHLIAAYGADPGKVRVIYHGLDLQRFRPRPRPANAEPLILAAGRLVEQKGFDRLLRACATLLQEGQRFRCHIVGEGPLRVELEHLAQRLGCAERVRFLGKMFQEDLIEQYARADLFALICVPASDEDRDGIPNTIMEAMAMNLPVVSTRFSGIPELVTHGETGLLVEGNDHGAVVAALRALLSDSARCQQMGAAGGRRVRQAFTLETSTAALDELFREVAHAWRTGRAGGPAPWFGRDKLSSTGQPWQPVNS